MSRDCPIEARLPALVSDEEQRILRRYGQFMRGEIDGFTVIRNDTSDKVFVTAIIRGITEQVR